MPVALAMESDKADEPGAPIAKDAIDPELIKLKRARPKIGAVTALGIVVLSVYFLIRVGPDRRFAGSGSTPALATAAQVTGGEIGVDKFVVVDAEPLVAHAIRSTQTKGALGLRVVPARGTNEQLWLVLPGDGWDAPQLHGYAGRLRKLDDLPLAASVRDYAASHARPLFATTNEVRGGLGAGELVAITGEKLRPSDADRVAYDVVDPNVVTVVCTLNERLATPAAWATALTEAGITPTKPPLVGGDQARFEIATSATVDALTHKLEAGSLWAARVEPVMHHTETTWGALRAAPPPPSVEVVAIFVARAIPDGAYALITGERPEDYWYVMPVTIALAAIGLLFAWALVRAVRRDLLAPRA